MSSQQMAADDTVRQLEFTLSSVVSYAQGITRRIKELKNEGEQAIQTAVSKLKASRDEFARLDAQLKTLNEEMHRLREAQDEQEKIIMRWRNELTFCQNKYKDEASVVGHLQQKHNQLDKIAETGRMIIANSSKLSQSQLRGLYRKMSDVLELVRDIQSPDEALSGAIDTKLAEIQIYLHPVSTDRIRAFEPSQMI
ncbi:hypothetical protein OIV83_006058 [Microbotryomycetes sp. JL201]|nr:hypothetical protein OIV83_006058 [Microbotryomycetes sp. JL201]